jgi:hypothetical protein
MSDMNEIAHNESQDHKHSDTKAFFSPQRPQNHINIVSSRPSVKSKKLVKHISITYPTQILKIGDVKCLFVKYFY